MRSARWIESHIALQSFSTFSEDAISSSGVTDDEYGRKHLYKYSENGTLAFADSGHNEMDIRLV